MTISNGRNSFNADWMFKHYNTDRNGKVYEKTNWRKIQIPHDWSIEKGFDKELGEGNTGFLTGGLGFYKKEFTIDDVENKIVYIHFDGVYNHSECLLNGTKLGYHPYGYSPFYYRLDEHLTNGNNVLEINVDRTRYLDSRWYAGSGIYRNVEIQVLDKIHIPVWGTFITTKDITNNKANIQIDYDLANYYNDQEQVELTFKIVDSNNNLIYEKQEQIQAQKGTHKHKHEFSLDNPKLWHIHNGVIYTSTIEITKDNKIIDSYETKFGIRKFHFDPDKGFYLNDQNMKIKGICLHHEAGLVGSAVPKDVWRRRLLKLQILGCNAIRMAHNPSSTELLDLCDEMGFLVQDEFFDEWDRAKDKRQNMENTHDDYLSEGYAKDFLKWSETDITNTVLSHKNHPSIFQWSIGNEIEWSYNRFRKASGYPFSGFYFNQEFGQEYYWDQTPYSIEEIRHELSTFEKETHDLGETAKRLSKCVKSLDNTRLVIANSVLPSASFEGGFTDELDVVGLSYRAVMYDYLKEHYPNKIIMGTENWVQYHEWKAVLDRDFVSGLFLWTGIDYVGETREWPHKLTKSGMIDIAGFEGPSYYMYKSLWQNEPSIHITTQSEDQSIFQQQEDHIVEKENINWKRLKWIWHKVNKHWNYNDNEKTIVEVYSNCDEVELFLNDNSLGKKKLQDFEDHIYKWAVPFSKGELKAVGSKNGKSTTYKIATSGKPTKIQLSSDKDILHKNTKECSHITIRLLDDQNNRVYNQEEELLFTINGNIRKLGLDNGSDTNVQSPLDNTVTTENGKALLILQESSISNVANIKVQLKSNQDCSNTIKITVK